ncbi:MAG: type I-E CRISPR-associated protein Cse1/CasA [Gallionella sp.]|nr:type I-E CRISPR-associated protein Cse1/CasA [Gallionella sp.]
MTTENRFNLIDEPWIPIVDVGLVSLRQVFSHADYRALGGNPVQKIALTKLLLAIAQSACTPDDDDDWAVLGAEGLAQKCLEYLNRWHGRFYLYGEKPFLQMPGLDASILNEKEMSSVSIGYNYYPSLPSENNTILTQSNFIRDLDLSERAIFIITQMNMSLRSSAIIKALKGREKISCASSGPSVGSGSGYVHSFLIGLNLLETLWMNMLTREKIEQATQWVGGLGTPPWEQSLQSQNCENAQKLKSSYMGCLVGMSRFMLLEESKVFLAEGVKYPTYKDGWFEPSVSADMTTKDIKPLLLSVHKKPWRELTALLSFVNATSQKGYECMQIRQGFERLKTRKNQIGIWSGGLKVTYSMKDQKCKEDDDFVESLVMLPAPNEITGSGSTWFGNLSIEMKNLEDIATKLANAVYFCSKREIRDSKERDKRADSIKKQAQNLFWQLCEKRFQDLAIHAGQAEEVALLRKIFADFVHKAYDSYCPNDSARQLDAWAKNRPNLSNYLKNPNKEAA